MSQFLALGEISIYCGIDYTVSDEAFNAGSFRRIDTTLLPSILRQHHPPYLWMP
jgi:hypothetical protein